MATKKAKSKAVTPTTEHLPADFGLAEQIAEDLKNLQKQVGGASVLQIRMSGKGFTTPDGELHDTIRGVIVDFASANIHYPGKYVKDDPNPTPPNCFALHKIINEMAPHPTAPDPQAEMCSECPLNKFESGVGKSKACKNTRKLALIQENATAESPIWLLTVPPKSLTYFDTYVSSALSGQHGITPICAVTEIKMDPREDYAAPRFAFDRLLDEKELVQYYQRRSEAENLLMQPPRVSAA
jgi:hypothetical protein